MDIINKICSREEKTVGFIAVFPILCVLLVSVMTVGCKQPSPEATQVEEDAVAKQKMQGVWMDEENGNVSFRALGDTIYYPDSVSQPVHFYIISDSIVFDSSHPMKCAIRLLTENSLRFINSEGDEINLQKSDDKSHLSLFEKAAKIISVNQGKLIKRDTVINAGQVRYHAYIQVNPTTYKVYRTSINNDGVSVDNAYFDNIIHLALYENSNAIINKDYRKQDFESYVPKEFISQCVFSDIEVEKATEDGMSFVAILTIPDTYTCYNVKIFVSRKGEVKISL